MDINGIYGKMDFYTRDHYRHAVEKIAIFSNLSEQAVAEMAIHAAKESYAVNNDPRLSHVGYYLTGKGYVATAKAANARTTTFEKCRRITNKYPLLIYLGGICILSFLICWLLIAEASTELLSEQHPGSCMYCSIDGNHQAGCFTGELAEYHPGQAMHPATHGLFKRHT